MSQNQPTGLREETPGPVPEPDSNPNQFQVAGPSTVISLDHRLILQDLQQRNLAESLGTMRGSEHFQPVDGQLRLKGPYGTETRLPLSQFMHQNVLAQAQWTCRENLSHLQALGLLRPLPAGTHYQIGKDLRVYFRGMPTPEMVQLMSAEELQAARQAARQAWLPVDPPSSTIGPLPDMPRITTDGFDRLIAAVMARPLASHCSFRRAQDVLRAIRLENPSNRWALNHLGSILNDAERTFKEDLDLIRVYVEGIDRHGISRDSPLASWYPQCASRLCGVDAGFSADPREWENTLKPQMYAYLPRKAADIEENLDRYSRALSANAPAFLAHTLVGDLRAFVTELEGTIPDQLRDIQTELSSLVEEGPDEVVSLSQMDGPVAA